MSVCVVITTPQIIVIIIIIIIIIIITRMVQLPATAATEYVAACWVSGAGGIFVRGCFCPGVF